MVEISVVVSVVVRIVLSVVLAGVVAVIVPSGVWGGSVDFSSLVVSVACVTVETGV